MILILNIFFILQSKFKVFFILVSSKNLISLRFFKIYDDFEFFFDNSLFSNTNKIWRKTTKILKKYLHNDEWNKWIIQWRGRSSKFTQISGVCCLKLQHHQCRLLSTTHRMLFFSLLNYRLCCCSIIQLKSVEDWRTLRIREWSEKIVLLLISNCP